MTDNIIFSSDAAADLSRFLEQKKYSKVTVLSDMNTSKYCYPKVQSKMAAHDKIVIESGEEAKNIATCEVIWSKMTDMAMDRHAVLVVIGGGVLGDMGGFCAATYKRGIDFILIPTTLLSQVDASIGGKLGVDFNHYKNHIGVFQTPVLTLLDAGFLSTLPEEEKRSGFAEVIKHALIADKRMWDVIKRNSLGEQDWKSLLKHSVDVKLNIVSEDPYEKGLRKSLNLGHTIGHALETYLLNEKRKILHGEAVAAGLICEGFLARERQMLAADEFDDLCTYIRRIFGKVTFREEETEAIAALAKQDKKNKGNKILCVLLEGIGKARWDCEVRPEDVKRALSFYCSA
jgi:3-dehydroquinate synthase